MDLFDAYFQRADLDRDGRISGAEAVAFFQGSNLPKNVLAQVWTYALQNPSGTLSRPEFYNALRLVTVAQSGRELTPDIVKAALGPAATKIPAPKINHAVVPSAQVNSVAAPTNQSTVMRPPPTSMSAMGANVLQNVGVRGQLPPTMGVNQQILPTSNNHLVRPGLPAAPTSSLPMQGMGLRPSPGVSVTSPGFSGSIAPPSLSTGLGGMTTAVPTPQFPSRGVAPVNQGGLGPGQLGIAPGVTTKPQVSANSSSLQSLQAKPIDQHLPSSQPVTNDSRALVPSGNGFSSDPAFGGDIFSANTQAKPETSTSSLSSGNFLGSSNSTSVYQNIRKPAQPEPTQNTPVLAHGGGQLQGQSVVKKDHDSIQVSKTLGASNMPVGPISTVSTDSQLSWPKMTHTNIQKYTKVFLEVDKDRDGKITGPEARNLFLSWRLPREILKQVWDLADQDNDSMLSLKEFCISLYLMERYREGRPLPSVLPNSIAFDEILLLSTGQHTSSHSGSPWQQHPGLTQHGVPRARPVMPSTVMKPPRPPLPSLPEEPVPSQQQKARVPVLEKHLVNQLSEEEQKAIESKFKEATDADKKVQELEKEILESKEKTEYYRTKMQELILYKSRCDNRLNEVTERISADKREVELLARKYEEKYKQTGDVASKLTLDEATFRDIQERKLELYNAIVKMEQGGTADGALQERVNRIQHDLEELVKTLNERCKQYGLRAKPTTLVELPFGWQPGIQEEAADWDEDWDKFNDEGFTMIKELTLEVENKVAKPKSAPGQTDDKTAPTGVSAVSTVAKDEHKTENGKHEAPTVSVSSNEENNMEEEKPSGTEDHTAEVESSYAHSEDGSSRSPHASPKLTTLESSSPEYQSRQFGTHDVSPRTKGSQSDRGGAESNLSGDKYFEESSWDVKFDNDDAESIWGLSTIITKDASDHDRGFRDSFFGPGDFSLNPIRTESPSAESVFGADKRGPFFDSVPSTPMYNSAFSPRFSDGPEDHAFDRFSRFDSFSMTDGGLFTPRDSFSRFDSTHSTVEQPSLSRFDSMRSTADGPFGSSDTHFGSFARFDSMRSTADPPSSFARFDSIRSTSGFGGGFPSFDDADPFGSTGPFKSSESQTPRRSSDSWSAF